MATIISGGNIEWGFILKATVMILFSFGLVIFIHELGHFLAAKMVGVLASDFALGMGPEIFGITRGETRYKLCAFPIGGYVKMLGEEDEDVPENLRHRSLRAKRTWQKVFVIFAGPFMNFILAIVLGAGILMIWGEPRELPLTEKDLAPVVTIGLADPRKPAGKAGMKTNDTIVSINGNNVVAPLEVKKFINSSSGKPLTFVVKRDFKLRTYKITPKTIRVKDKRTGKMRTERQVGIFMSTPTPRIVDAVAANSPAAHTGVKKGDIVLAIDSQDFTKTGAYISGEPVTDLIVYRKGKSPAHISFDTKPGAPSGISFASTNSRVGPIDAVVRGTTGTIQQIVLMGVGIKMMIAREVPADDIAGPVGIVQYASSFARSGLRDFIAFFAMISVSLAIINLVPFPALDGSIIAMFLWEGITRKPLDPHKQGIVIYVGFCILMGLIALVTFRDLRIWLGF